MAAWSNDDWLVKPVTVCIEGSSGYVAKETVLTSSERSSVIAENVVIYE
jgi:hypothetical protein